MHLKKRFDITVSGIVQGVGYRAFTFRAARELGIEGYVENLHNGRVHAVAEGGEVRLEKLISMMRDGPPASKVTDIEAIEEDPTGEFHNFTIRM